MRPKPAPNHDLVGGPGIFRVDAGASVVENRPNRCWADLREDNMPSGTQLVALRADAQPNEGCAAKASRNPDVPSGRLFFCGWAELREDKMINPAPDFWPIFGPLRPTAGPGSPGIGPCSKKSAGCAKNQPRRPILSPIRWHFVFSGPTAKI